MSNKKYTKQDWIDGKVAIKGNPKKKDKANAFFRSVYPETQKDAMFNRNRFYTYLDDSGLICWDIHYPVTLPTCDIDDIIWEGNPEKQPENYPENSIEKVLRFKTEKEFLEEYGEHWRSANGKSKFAFIESMYYLFGKVKSEADTSRFIIEDWMLTDKPLLKEEHKHYITVQEGSYAHEFFDAAPFVAKDYDFVNPSHYKQSPIETIDMMVAIWGKEKVADYCEICVFKYRSRIGNKPDQPVERELEKIKWYENKAKELRQ